ncbi:PD-(D/E)XK nuclease family protein [Robertkochia aurantiaca]|uniref:PD-(D/E)XK nuclease family protein n=1 Tax=Robertkochia aurantiaca TaxID=2873700 RepID=UPI001CD02062|nr:PD-(D/E)XK nuclease family protein [Robertkochia sp. 3YJGBD-33]
MQPFLTEVAREIHENHKDELGSLLLIVPGKRSGTFLKEALKKHITHATLAPEIISIEEFVESLSGLRSATSLALLFEFYAAYKEITPEKEQDDFNAFMGWAQVMLQDFNEIDRYLIPPEKILNHLFDIKEIDQWHWTADTERTELQKNYLSFWKKLHRYYGIFKEALKEKGIGYQGLLYREATEKLEHFLHHNAEKIVYFIGFNALNNAEQHIIQEILEHNRGDIYWDADTYFLEHPEHDAGFFMRRYFKKWRLYHNRKPRVIGDHFSKKKNISITGASDSITMARYAGRLLQTPETGLNWENTAIVMGNEEMLIPLLTAIPEQIPAINITGGMPLKLSPVTSFFDTLFDLWTRGKDGRWYYKDVLNVLNHPFFKTINSHDTHWKGIIKTIHKQNLIYIDDRFLLKDITDEADMSWSSPIFSGVETAGSNELTDRILLLIQLAKDQLEKKQDDNLLLREYLYRFHQLFNQLKYYDETYQAFANLEILRKLFKEVMSRETIDFKGEPLQGLQVMGMLESRNLDFQNIIVTSVNEGILPAGKSQNSFLPFDIKRAYGLPTYKEKDAIYTYHFYRLLQRAENIHLLYSTETDSLEGGEPSRFIKQLLMETAPEHVIEHKLVSARVNVEAAGLKEMEKDPVLTNQLHELASRGLSPSSLTAYIRNPIDFYKQYVLGIQDEDTVEESIAANTFGTIIHDSLEELYKPYTGKTLTSQSLSEMKNRQAEVVAEQYRKAFPATKNLEGKNLLSFHVAGRYIENFINWEQSRLDKGHTIVILQVETSLEMELSVPGLDRPARIKGKVDRVESCDGQVQVIDYKTGNVTRADLTIKNWELLSQEYKYSKAFQVLCYSLMLAENFPEYRDFTAGIISFKNLNSGLLSFKLSDTNLRLNEKPEQINKEVLDHFKATLSNLISEIVDSKTALTEKEI